MRDYRGLKGFPWLICDLQPLGKRLVRGPREFPQKWFTFCPKRKFPKDRVLISECKRCPHFQGYRLSFSEKVAQSLDEFGTPTQEFRVRVTKPKFRDEVRTISEEALKLAVEKKKHEDEEWEEEERKLMEYYKKEKESPSRARQNP